MIDTSRQEPMPKAATTTPTKAPRVSRGELMVAALGVVVDAGLGSGDSLENSGNPEMTLMEKVVVARPSASVTLQPMKVKVSASSGRTVYMRVKASPSNGSAQTLCHDA
jgi:hypothetical protein